MSEKRYPSNFEVRAYPLLVADASDLAEREGMDLEEFARIALIALVERLLERPGMQEWIAEKRAERRP